MSLGQGWLRAGTGWGKIGGMKELTPLRLYFTRLFSLVAARQTAVRPSHRFDSHVHFSSPHPPPPLSPEKKGGGAGGWNYVVCCCVGRFGNRHEQVSNCTRLAPVDKSKGETIQLCEIVRRQWVIWWKKAEVRCFLSLPCAFEHSKESVVAWFFLFGNPPNCSPERANREFCCKQSWNCTGVALRPG